jgi:hypothetical protein
VDCRRRRALAGSLAANLDDAQHSPPRPAVTPDRPIPPNPFRHAVEMGSPSQQHGPPPDESELYRRMPFMSQEVWESLTSATPSFVGRTPVKCCFRASP